MSGRRSIPVQTDGYNFAINKMHFILSRYPLKSEAYLRNTQAPDLFEYLIWKTLSTKALVQKMSINQILQEFERQLHADPQPTGPSYRPVSPSLSQATTVIQADSPELGAAMILNAMQYTSILMNSTIFAEPHADPLPTDPAQSAPKSPKFPRPDDLAMPSGEDAWLLNPALEDAQRRWVRGFHKEDQVREVMRLDAQGNKVWVKKTVYIVDGKEFHDVEPQGKKATRPAAKRGPPKLNISAAAMANSMTATSFREPRSRKRPLDSGIALDSAYEDGTNKRVHYNPEDDIPLSSMSRPGLPFGGGSPTPSLSEDSEGDLPGDAAPFVHPSQGALFNGMVKLKAPNVKGTPTHSRDSEIMLGPLSSTQASGRRRGPPAPITIPDLPSSPSPVKTSNTPRKRAPPTPQHSSPVGTPRKNKYVPNTPKPFRWTPTELYHLNALARQGLHPKELHPLMMEQFPDRPRSIHAIKDRRDKMSRAKELIGKVPDYEAKYANVEESQK